MIRRGIRAVQQAQAPWRPDSPDGQTIPTYSQDRVVSGIPLAATPEADRQTLLETARQVLEDCQRQAQQHIWWDAAPSVPQYQHGD